MSVDHDQRSRRSRVSTASSSGSSPRESNAPLPVKPPSSLKLDSRHFGHTADDFYDDRDITPSADTATRGTLERRKTSSYTRSSPRRTRDRSSTRDLLRLLVAEERDSKEALAVLRTTAERLELETQRANDAERRFHEANDRWKLVNQARMQAQSEASRINEELRLYKHQLEAAQSQIARANDLIAQTDREKVMAEDEAAKAKRLARKYEMETLIQKARDEGRRLGRDQGLREGREQAYISAYDEAYFRARREAMGKLRNFIRHEFPAGSVYEDEEDAPEYSDEEQYDEQDGDIPPMRAGLSAAPAMEMPIPQVQQDIPLRRTRDQMRSMADAPPPHSHRSNGLLGGLSRIRRRTGPPNMDRNVEVNRGAPDVATIVEDRPGFTVATPLPHSDTAQMGRAQTPMDMPEPNFNPNPAEVRPISVYNRVQSPMHPPVDFPPDGYIPRQEADGSILLPPPHELQPAPPTPISGNSPLPIPQSLPVPAPPKEMVARDFMYANEHPPHGGRHRYQKSVAESVASTNTSNLSIISPPDRVRPAVQPRLSAIPEHDGRYSSPSGSMQQSDANGFVSPGRPRSRSSMHRREEGDALGMNGIYQTGAPSTLDDPGYANRQQMANDYQDTGPVRPTDMAGTFSPRPVRTSYSGPRRPTHITTPDPLAATYGSAYTRPRVNSGTSDMGFDSRSARGRERTTGSEYNRSRPVTTGNSTVAELPEINIEPPSRSESLQSRINAPLDGLMSPRISERPVSSPILGMPSGSVPTTPGVSQPPLAFVPTSPIVPEGAPPGFVPTSPAAPEGAPPGFVLTSPAVPPGAPPGFVPVSPVPDGAPPGFVPLSPGAPEGAPPGFVPTPTTIPVDPLPGEANQAVSPNMSITGALPVLLRSASGDRGSYCNAGTATPRSGRVSYSGTDAGFHARGGREWDSRSAWGDNRSDAYSPRPVRAPEPYSGSYEPPRPASPRPPGVVPSRSGTSMSRRESAYGDPAPPSMPVIPDMSAYAGSRPVSPGMRRASRVSFGALDPASVPIPPSAAPSLARSGRSSSHGSRTPAPSGVSRASSVRSEAARMKVYPYPPPAAAGMSAPGMPPAGLSSPYSRRLEPYPEREDDEDEPVPSPHSSAYTLTAPAAVAPSLHKSTSRLSVGSSRSHARFDKNDYVDPAVLASGESTLLPRTGSSKGPRAGSSKGHQIYA